MKKYMYMLFPLYSISIVFSLSASSWMMIWMGMELNLLSFIFIILHEKTILSTESSMKYFMIQAMGSLIFLFAVSMSMIFYNETSLINAIVPPLALILKSGMAPLHSWTPPIVSKFSFLGMFMFLTWQKLVPLFILFSSWFSFITWIAFINIIMGSVGGITQSSLPKMMIFSSINNIGWMLMSMMESVFLFFIFFSCYVVINFLVIKFMSLFNIKWIIQIKSNKMNIKLYFFSFLMSLAGLPPFLGFLPKWLVIKKTWESIPLITFTAIIFSIFTLFFYLKSSVAMMIASSSMVKWNISPSLKMKLIFMMITNSTSPFLFIVLT
uniref:NADH-ubiquinone oxidoreductase chain 2 n=1 Tax=Trioza frangulae TaxID=3035953 RepID=A0A9Y1PTA2_9HEMI|nr:NADH dehydrogenase subunit 2 [Trioza frangulae]WET58375.1 NADH dehydrogenase subunit 2 [Trioza frangulae]